MIMVPRPLTDWLKSLFDRFAAFGVRASLEEAAAGLAETANAARKRGLNSTLESLRYANELGDGDEATREAIAIFKQATVEQARNLGRLLEGPAEPSDAGRALSGPFVAATPTVTSLPDGSHAPALQAPEPGTAVPQQASGENGTQSPSGKKRGRPTKEEVERRKALARGEEATPSEGTSPDSQ